jgi:2-(1,2-epoxy-1,2-dihydrophenyl)acetyl-CoA isomerase
MHAGFATVFGFHAVRPEAIVRGARGEGGREMTYETIQLEIRDQVATITLDRPEVMNALNPQMRLDLIHALRHAPGQARAIVLTGAGDAFCSGQDLGEARHAPGESVERILREEYMPLIEALVACPVPTLAAVNGTAAGAGASLALSADVVIAARSARFILAFARIGLIPDCGATYAMPRQIGLPRAMGAALFGDPIGAEQAADWGLIWEAVADESLSEVVAARARHLAEGPTLAYQLLRQAFRASSGNDLIPQMELEARLQGEAARSRDFKEGVVAFHERRPPRFEGR